MVQLAVVATAHFAVEEGFLRDDVAFQPTLYTANVGGGLIVDAAQRQLGQYFGGNDDGGEAFLRLYPGVGGPASNVGGYDVLGRGGDGDAVHRALSIEDHAGLGGQPLEVQVMHPHQTAFLRTGEGYFDGTMAGA